MINYEYFILLAAILLIVGVITTKFSSRLGVPALVLFIAVGMLFGSDGIGLIHFENANLAQLIGVFALIILYCLKLFTLVIVKRGTTLDHLNLNCSTNSSLFIYD